MGILPRGLRRQAVGERALGVVDETRCIRLAAAVALGLAQHIAGALVRRGELRGLGHGREGSHGTRARREIGDVDDLERGHRVEGFAADAVLGEHATQALGDEGPELL